LEDPIHVARADRAIKVAKCLGVGDVDFTRLVLTITNERIFPATPLSAQEIATAV
jgi:hypothetical protein